VNKTKLKIIQYRIMCFLRIFSLERVQTDTHSLDIGINRQRLRIVVGFHGTSLDLANSPPSCYIQPPLYNDNLNVLFVLKLPKRPTYGGNSMGL
jgi:hypothetical protein